MTVIFQECPGCACLIPVDDYAELHLLDRVVHLMHCRYCRRAAMLTVYPGGRSVTMTVRHPEAGYVSFVRLLDEVQRGTAKRRETAVREVRDSARAA